MQSFASVKTALEDATRFDAMIIDGKPNASEQTAEIAKAADLVVIPTRQPASPEWTPSPKFNHSSNKAPKGRASDTTCTSVAWLFGICLILDK